MAWENQKIRLPSPARVGQTAAMRDTRKYTRKEDRNGGRGDFISCACGCGRNLYQYDEKGRKRRYINGHWLKRLNREMTR